MSEPIHVSNIAIVGGNSGVSGDMTSRIDSVFANLDGVISFSVQASFSGTPTGTIRLEASDDLLDNSSSVPVNWTPISDSSVTISQAGTYMVNYEFPSYSFVKLVYLPSGGNGTMGARLNTKKR